MSAIHIIVAMTHDGVIGNQGSLPWTLPEDLQLFRQLTTGQTVVMGRVTFESIGQPLRQRNNIVVSRHLEAPDGVRVCPSFTTAMEYALTLGSDIFCIGGAEIYRQALDIADYLHISWIEQQCQGDRHFPPFDLSDWTETERRPCAGFVYCRYRRKDKSAP